MQETSSCISRCPGGHSESGVPCPRVQICAAEIQSRAYLEDGQFEI